MELRIANTKDIDIINDLYYELDTHAIELLPHHFQRGVRSCEYLKSVIEDEESDFILAIINNEVVGFSQIIAKEVKDISILIPYKYAYVLDIVVSEKMRNQGIGSKLMEESKRWAKRELSYLKLSVLYDNVSAQHFYEKHGFNKQAIEMECSL